MIDKKKIEEAAGAFVAHKRFLDTMTKNDLVCGFKQGARWAIEDFLKDLWHDASEKPRKCANCLVYVSCEYGATPENNYKEYITSMYLGGDWSLGCFPPEIDVYPIKWCYLDDILP